MKSLLTSTASSPWDSLNSKPEAARQDGVDGFASSVGDIGGASAASLRLIEHSSALGPVFEMTLPEVSQLHLVGPSSAPPSSAPVGGNTPATTDAPALPTLHAASFHTKGFHAPSPF